MVRPNDTNVFLAKLREIGVARVAILTALGFAGTWFAAALAISGVARIKAPQTALVAIANDSIALASRADQIYFSSPQNPPREVELLARQALVNQAINAKALRVLGYTSDARGDVDAAEKYINLAAKLSRREPGAQLWLIEASARKGDIVQTLLHYDIALRTKPDTHTILFPRLLSAIEDREVRSALRPYLRSKNSWAPSFLDFAIAKSNNLPAIVDLIIETGGLTDADKAKASKLALLGRLVSQGQFVDARRLYLQTPEANAARLLSAEFDASDQDARFGPMGWQLIDDPDAGGSFTGNAKQQKTTLSIFVNPATTRLVARKLLYLKPGIYQFSVSLAKFDRGDGGFLRWQLSCPANPPASVWIIDSISASFRAKLAVPGNCQVQFLDLIASGGNGQTGLEATITAVSLMPTY